MRLVVEGEGRGGEGGAFARHMYCSFRTSWEESVVDTRGRWECL